MSHEDSRPINVIAVSRGGASSVVALTFLGMCQDHHYHPPRPSVGSPATHVSTNTFQVLVTPRVLAVRPNATVTRGTGTVLTEGAHHRPQVVAQAASGRAHYYCAPRTITPAQPNNGSVASVARPAALSRPSVYPSSLSPRPPPLSNAPHYASSSDNQDRADPRGFHFHDCAEGTNGNTTQRQVGHARVFADSRGAAVAGRTPAVGSADHRRRGRRNLVGPEYFAGGGPMARKYLDGAWGVTPGTKESLGLTD